MVFEELKYASVGKVLKFYEDMGDPPFEDASIDRKDPNGNYCPENCRWATKKEQSRNQRRSTMVTYKGITKQINEWSDEIEINVKTLRTRIIQRGWSVERAFTTRVIHD